MASLALLLLAVGLAGARTSARDDPAALPLERGIDAIEAGDLEAASHHLQAALRFRPHSSEILGRLLEAAQGDGDARWLWGRDLVLAAADANGRPPLDRRLRELLAEDQARLLELSAARASATEELVALARKLTGKGKRGLGDPVVARWVEALARELTRPAPALASESGRVFAAARDSTRPNPRYFLRMLDKAMDQAARRGDEENALLLAQRLRGLARQAGFKDLPGPKPPPTESLGEEAVRTIGRMREKILENSHVYGVDQLYEMGEEEAFAFTEAHATWARPGVASSEEGLYRVETICGWETLVGVATTVDLHHRRLANWYGQDPFEGRPGVVRVVPEFRDLESEGSPFWWAGGFQSGDVTSVQFACGTIEGLGRGLTHELTHRFDAVIYPGLPAWLAEGRAVWTGAAYGLSIDDRFVPHHVSFGTMERALVKGYGGLRNLEKLLDGTVDDYRDNYVAGYALYVYLNTWEEDGRRLFQDQLRQFLENASRGASKPVEFFTALFADGRDGRPGDLETFAAGFGEFLQGFYWDSRAPWTSRYTQKVEGPKEHWWVWDLPTWTWSRDRAEPYWGQDQAAATGDLLYRLGETEAAAAAYAFAMEVDEWQPLRARRLAELLEKLGAREAAWVLRHENHRWFPAERTTTADPGPYPGRLDRVRRLLELQAQVTDELRERDLVQAAAALAADHDRLAEFLGEETLAPALIAARDAVRLHPLAEPATWLGVGGFDEHGLTGYEERRVEGLWSVTSEGDVLVGRREERAATGLQDRFAHQRDAFVRSVEWLDAGRYRVSARVQINTSFVAGALVVGYTRRDRNVRVLFRAGDWLYSVGKKDEATEIESVHLEIAGLRPRDGALGYSVPSRTVEFERPTSSFQLEVLVDGASLTLRVDGNFVGNYHVPDGVPIEGHVGFAASQGSYRVQSPTLQRLDRTRTVILDPAWPRPLTVAETEPWSITERRNRPCRGIPLHPSGTILLWIPPQLDYADGQVVPARAAAVAEHVVRAATRQLEQTGLPQDIVLAVPDNLPDDVFERLSERLHATSLDRATLLRHAAVEVPDLDPKEGEHENTPRLVFVDPKGIARAVQTFEPSFSELGVFLKRWARVFQRGAEVDALARPEPEFEPPATPEEDTTDDG